MADTTRGGESRGCARPVPPHGQDGLPLRAEACTLPVTPKQAQQPPPPRSSAPQATSPWNFHTCSRLTQKEAGNRRHPWEREVKEGSSCPDWRGEGPSSQVSGYAHQPSAWALPALLAPAPSGARALLSADVPPKQPSPLLLPSRCSPFSAPQALPGLGKTQAKTPFVSDTEGLGRPGDGSRGWRRHFRPYLQAPHGPGNNAHLGQMKQEPSCPRGHLPPGLTPDLQQPVGAAKGRAPVPWPDGDPVPGVPGGRRGVPPSGACSARLWLCPRALGAQPGRRRAHLSLSAVAAAAAAALRNPGRMWRKLWLRSSLGWLLVRLMEPLRRRLRKPCARGDKRGKGRRG